jgi:hypothetical protein
MYPEAVIFLYSFVSLCGFLPKKKARRPRRRLYPHNTLLRATYHLVKDFNILGCQASINNVERAINHFCIIKYQLKVM